MEHVRGVADRDEQFSAKEVLTSYTLDCIASCGFGVEANSFKEPDGTFRKMVRREDDCKVDLVEKLCLTGFFLLL